MKSFVEYRMGTRLGHYRHCGHLRYFHSCAWILVLLISIYISVLCCIITLFLFLYRCRNTNFIPVRLLGLFDLFDRLIFTKKEGEQNFQREKTNWLRECFFFLPLFFLFLSCISSLEFDHPFSCLSFIGSSYPVAQKKIFSPPLASQAFGTSIVVKPPPDLSKF